MRASSGDSSAVRWHRITRGAAAWLGILLAIGTVQVVREQWFDALVFAGAALALALAAVLGPGGGVAAPASRAVALCAAALGLAIGLVLLLAPRYSTSTQLAVCAAGALAIVLAWPQRAMVDGARTPGQRRLAVAWAIVIVIGCLWELAQFIVGRMHPERPAFALSELLDPLMQGAPGRVLFAVAWLALGALLVLRGRCR